MRDPPRWFQILAADLHERLDMRFERGRGDFFRQSARDPRLQGIQLMHQCVHRLGLLGRVVPVDIERGLDTRRHEQGTARLRTDLLDGPPEQVGGTLGQVAGRVRQQVERVFNPSCALQRTRIDRHAQRLGQLARVERLGPRCQGDRAFEHPTIQVGRDQPFAKGLQRTLRKGRRLGPETAQHHLHSQVDQRQLDHLGIGQPQVALHQRRHGHHRGWPRLFPRARGAVHRGQLLLKRIVKQFVPMPSQKAQQLANATKPLQQELLLSRQRHGRGPARHPHQSASRGHRPTDGSDHRSHDCTHRKN
jgi:hypothetical protein